MIFVFREYGLRWKEAQSSSDIVYKPQIGKLHAYIAWFYALLLFPGILCLEINIFSSMHNEITVKNVLSL